MPALKKTKIIATLGPSTSSEKVLKDMIDRGVNLFRINFSHADYDEIKRLVNTIRKLGTENDFPIGILADLQGPKLRVGMVKDGAKVSKGDVINLITGEAFEGDSTKAYMNYENFPKDVNVGERILLDDGKLIFEILETDRQRTVKVKVIQGGDFKSKKGVNLPNTKISLPALTEKDIKDAIFAINLGVDWIALSFVRNKKDLDDLRKLINENSKKRIPIISKIEKPEALDNIDEIIANSEGLMVARGDLGVEIPSEEVPLYQKMLVQKAKKACIPVIIATQMMETMIESLTPTRAEVNDVANSIMDGADAVMLSGETSVGKYPIQVIEKMSSIIRSVEDSKYISIEKHPPMKHEGKDVNISEAGGRFITDSVCYHAAIVSKSFKASVISTLTNSGYTAYKISSWRPDSLILVFTSNKDIINQLSLLWGVYAFYYDKFVTTDETIRDVNAFACKKGYLQAGDILISLAAMPIKDKGMVNTLRITEVLTCDIK